MVARGDELGGQVGGQLGSLGSTMLFLKWITNKDLLYSPENPAQCYVVAWRAGEFGEEWIQIYVWLSPFVVHLKLSQHC